MVVTKRLTFLTPNRAVFIRQMCVIVFCITQSIGNYIHFLIVHLLLIHIRVESEKEPIKRSIVSDPLAIK